MDPAVQQEVLLVVLEEVTAADIPEVDILEVEDDKIGSISIVL